MKKYIRLSRVLVLFMVIFSNMQSTTLAQSASLTGAWNINEGDTEQQLLLQDKHFFHTVYRKNQFVMSQGGTFELKDNKIIAHVLFHSENKDIIGQDYHADFSVSGDRLSLNVEGDALVFNRVDNGSGPLAGVWHITSRMQDGKVVKIHQTGARRTYKTLTGTKFQWAAINPETKEFSGTGGGSYTFSDGKYVENIAFFSKDNSRAGASLNFEGKLVNGEWHHSGLSSKGDKIYEIWSRVKL